MTYGSVNNKKSQYLLEAVNPRLEPPETCINKAQNEAFNIAYATMSGCWDDFRTFKWIKDVECPELIITDMRSLLQIY